MLVAYTCVTGDYDRLLPQPQRKGLKWVCFTDRPDRPAPAGWEIRPLASPPAWNGSSLANRWHKIINYRFEGASHSLYLDGNIALRTDPMRLITLAKDAAIALYRHQTRTRVTEELEALVGRKLAPLEVPPAREMVASHLAAGMPEDIRLSTNFLLLRRCDDLRLWRAMEHWWQMVSTLCRRDQLSLQFTLWREGIAPRFLDDDLPMAKALHRHGHQHGKPSLLARILGRSLSPVS